MEEVKTREKLLEEAAALNTKLWPQVNLIIFSNCSIVLIIYRHL